MSELKAKLKRLENLLKGLGQVSVALSGGLDSGVLLLLAKDSLGRKNVLALTCASEIMPSSDLAQARMLALKAGVRHLVLPFDHLALEAFKINPPERCYFCKKAMFSFFLEKSPYPLIDGSQVDDLKEERPGLKALNELKILSPLKEAGLNKKDLRKLARSYGLTSYKKAASPCLATRFLTGEPITKEGLAKVAKAEAYLNALGFSFCRVRIKENLCIIQVYPQESEKILSYQQNILETFKNIGFKKILIDLEGYNPPLKPGYSRS